MQKHMEKAIKNKYFKKRIHTYIIQLIKFLNLLPKNSKEVIVFFTFFLSSSEPTEGSSIGG